MNDNGPSLFHYGVMGMKWGVRKDGKPQGFQYGAAGKSARKIASNVFNAGKSAVSKEYEKYKMSKMSPAKRQEYMVSSLSDEQLAKYRDRLRRENEVHSELARTAELIKRGQQETQSAMSKIGKAKVEGRYASAMKSGTADAIKQITSKSVFAIGAGIIAALTGYNIADNHDKKKDKDRQENNQQKQGTRIPDNIPKAKPVAQNGGKTTRKLGQKETIGGIDTEYLSAEAKTKMKRAANQAAKKNEFQLRERLMQIALDDLAKNRASIERDIDLDEWYDGARRSNNPFYKTRKEEEEARNR